MQIKSTSGVTLTMLAIMVLVIGIIAGVSVYYGSNEIANSKEDKLLSEVQIVNQAVYEAYISYTKTQNDSYLVGEKLSKSSAESIASSMGVTLVSIPSTYEEDALSYYYRLTPENLNKIGIEEAKDTYIVNYLTGEVMNESVLKTASGKPLYTYSVNNFNSNGITSF